MRKTKTERKKIRKRGKVGESMWGKLKDRTARLEFRAAHEDWLLDFQRFLRSGTSACTFTCTCVWRLSSGSHSLPNDFDTAVIGNHDYSSCRHYRGPIYCWTLMSERGETDTTLQKPPTKKKRHKRSCWRGKKRREQFKKKKKRE